MCVENWLGKFGALTAQQVHLQMVRTCGVQHGAVEHSSVGIRCCWTSGCYLCAARLGWTAMALLWLPTVLGFFFRGEYMFLGGGVGFAITKHLTTLLGNFGAGALIVFAAGAFAVYTFNPRSSWLGNGCSPR
jgi:hypothetical protein